jgi:pilus assembly protein CpaF
MSLYRRLHEVQQAPTAPGGAAGRDPVLNDLRHKIHQRLIEELGPILYDSRLAPEDLQRKVHEQLHAALAQERAPLSAADKAQLIQDVSDDILGYGPIDRLLKDAEVSEIMVNGPNLVYVERKGKLTRDPISFVDASHLRRIIDKIVGQVGRRIDESTPLCDARPSRRLPRQCGDPTAGHRRAVPHDS